MMIYLYRMVLSEKMRALTFEEVTAKLYNRRIPGELERTIALLTKDYTKRLKEIYLENGYLPEEVAFLDNPCPLEEIAFEMTKETVQLAIDLSVPLENFDAPEYQ